MPDSWQLPERMATRALAEPTLWDAGTHLMQRASPASWEGIVAAANLARDNREPIEACGAAAAKAKKTVRCPIEVKHANNDRGSARAAHLGVMPSPVASRPAPIPPHTSARPALPPHSNPNGRGK